MQQINHRGYLLVDDLPRDAKDFVIDGELFFKAHFFGLNSISRMVKLPPGQWEIIGKGNEITEEVWAQILVKEDLYWEMSYRRYPEPGQELAFQEHIADTATESGHSLIKSHGMKPETTLILKLKTNE